MELKKYIAIVRHWLWLIILGAVLSGGVAFLISSNRPSIYRASARYLIDTPPGRQGNNYSEVLYMQKLTQTYVERFTTTPIMAAVVDELDLTIKPEALRRKITVSAPKESQVLLVSVQDTNHETAVRIANTIGDVFAEVNVRMQGARYTESIDRIERQLAELDLLLADLETQVNALAAAGTAASDVEFSRLNRQLAERRNDYNRAYQQRQDLLVERDLNVDNIIPIDPAVPNPEAAPVSPNVRLSTLIATLIGGALALGVVLLVEYLDDTVKTPDDVTELSGLSTLATISFIRGGSPPERLVTHLTPRDPISEAYRVLRTNLSFAAIDSGLRSLVVTSSAPGEGKSTTCANLGVVLAQTGKRVIVVDADLRRPTQHKIFETSNSQGLTTALLNNNTPINQHLQEGNVRGLRVLASGPLPPNPAELLNSNRMQEVIAELLEEADVVLIDSPPVMTVADAAILAPVVSGVLLVAEVGQTRRDAMIDAAERLRVAGATLFGLVLNRSKPGRLGYYQYYYYDQRYYTYNYNSTRSRADRPRRGLLSWLTGSGNST